MIENELKEKNSYLDSNFIENEKITRFPFHGKSKYLIDKLYIMGYDNATINKYLLEKANNKMKIEDPDCIDTSSKSTKGKLYYSKLINSNSKEMNSFSENIESFTIPHPPSIINEIVNDYNKKVLDEDIIINMIFPNKPKIYSIKESKRQFSPNKRSLKGRRNTNYFSIKTEIKNNINVNNDISEEILEIIENKKYCMVFSSNPQIDKKNKKSINGFCYVNYCKYKEKKLLDDYYCTIYLPIAICFISEFPYYNSYYKLAEQIFLLFNSKKIEVPIEIMLYNLINSTLSPINGDIELCIEPVSFHNNIISQSSSSISNINENSNKNENNENKNIKNENVVSPFNLNDFLIIEKEDETITFEKKNIGNFNLNNKKEEEKESNSSKILIHIEKKLDIRSSLKKTNVTKNNDKKKLMKTKTLDRDNYYHSKNLFEQIKFPFLQGYPLMQYNLPRLLFNNFSISKFIYIFINAFLEKDILIFSENIELLSFVINSLQNLNFPLNDNTYYNINGCISYNNYIYGNSKFISSAMNSIIGINSPFQLDSIAENEKQINEHIIYDLDSHEIYLKNKNDLNFYQYIKKILKLKDDKEYKGSLLFYEIKVLYESLNNVREQYRNLLISKQNQNYNNLFYNKSFNIQIQEACYRFIVNILVYYYRQLIYHMNMENINKTNNDDKQINIEFNENYESESDIKYKNTEEEKYFFNEFKNTFKYNLFFNNYINFHECLDLYNIPYLFFEEYISILSRIIKPNEINNYNLNFFNIFENIYNIKESQKTNVDFNPFLSEYFKKYKFLFERDIIDFNNEGKHIIKFLETKKTLQYQWYELDNTLLLNYILFVKTLDTEDYERMFNLNTILNENIPKKININDIENEIEKEIIEKRFTNEISINDDDICCMNIIILISISLKYINVESYISIIIGNLFKDFFLFRKYYHMLMDMIYRVIKYELYENKSKNIQRINNLFAFYYPCINSFREKNIIPSFKIINTILNMNIIDDDIRNRKLMEEINIKDNNHINEEKEKIDKNNYKLFIYHNFSQYKIIKVKEILEYINKDDKSDLNNWKNRLGFIVTLRGGEKKILIIPKIKYICKYSKYENEEFNLTVESEIFSQRKIKTILNEEYEKYINSNLDENSMNKRNIINCLLNIFIYIQNTKKFKEKYEIIEAFKIILYHHMNSLVK